MGLGNPGKKYEKTRHNVGFLVLDALLNQSRKQWAKGKGPFQFSPFSAASEKVMLAKPTVYMNESGVSVKALCDHFQTLPSDCLVVVDDVNLALGKMRFRSKGSAGGHHGLESIIREIATEEFPRLRIGVADRDLTGQDLTDYVLGNFSPEEWVRLEPQLERSVQASIDWLTLGAEELSRRYNG